MAEDKLDEDLDLGIEQGSGSKKKLIIIGGGVVLLLLIGLGVGWFMMGGEETEEDEEATEEVVEEEKLPAAYHALDPKFIVNLPPGGKAKMLQVSIQLMARDPALIEFLKFNDPMLRHTLLALFGSQDGDKLRDRKGKEKLQKDVLAAVNKIIKEQGGTGEVEAAFFTSFVMQ